MSIHRSWINLLQFFWLMVYPCFHYNNKKNFIYRGGLIERFTHLPYEAFITLLYCEVHTIDVHAQPKSSWSATCMVILHQWQCFFQWWWGCTENRCLRARLVSRLQLPVICPMPTMNKWYNSMWKEVMSHPKAIMWAIMSRHGQLCVQPGSKRFKQW